ncbi:MAG: hypothetical protein ACFCBW_22905 [Candidatus Competibacterales bacterium]
MTAAPLYQPFYCEENVWQLCARPDVVARNHFAVFIANPRQTVAMAAQRAAPPGQWVVWDYHVVLLMAPATGDGGESQVWDLDCRLAAPLALTTWFDASFPDLERWPTVWVPQFRLVEGQTFRRHFASDRRHMRTPQGGWQRPPPPWPPPGKGSHLADLIDVSATSDPLGGVVLSHRQLLTRYASPSKATTPQN